ncbi:MAG: GGDEF domain-containing protein [bacterium]
MPKFEFIIELDNRIIALLECVNKLEVSLSGEEMLSYIVKTIFEKFECRATSIALVNERTGTLEMRVAKGLSYGFIKDFNEGVKGNRVVEDILERGIPLLIDVNEESRYYGLMGEEVKSLIVAPISSGKKTVGFLHADSAEEDAFSEVDLAIIKALANLASFIVDTAKVRDEAKRIAVVDELTDMPNYRYFQQRLYSEIERVNRQGGHLSVLIVDIDRMADFNNTCGWEEGNRAIVEVSRIINNLLKRSDIAARYKEDEFMICLPDTDSNGAYIVAEKVRSAVEEEFLFRPGPNLTVSVGIVRVPEDANNIMELVAIAEMVIFDIKRRERNSVSFFEGRV